MESGLGLTWSVENAVSYSGEDGEASLDVDQDGGVFLRIWTPISGVYSIPLDRLDAKSWSERSEVFVDQALDVNGDLYLRIRKTR